MVTNNKLTESYNIQIMLLTNELDIQCLLGARNQVIHANQCNAMEIICSEIGPGKKTFKSRGVGCIPRANLSESGAHQI